MKYCTKKKPSALYRIDKVNFSTILLDKNMFYSVFSKKWKNLKSDQSMHPPYHNRHFKKHPKLN